MRIPDGKLRAEEIAERKKEAIKHPPHYTNHPSGVECIDIVKHFNYCLGNVIKYIWRADLKGKDIEDLQKAREYIDFEIQRRKDNEQKN